MQFTWSYFGRGKGVKSVTCGLKKGSEKAVDSNHGVLLSIECQTGKELDFQTPPKYIGRISVNFSGDQSYGQINFTLYPVEKDDEKHYGCQLTPVYNFEGKVFDFANLVVQGEFVLQYRVHQYNTYCNFPLNYRTFLGKKVKHTFSMTTQQEVWATSLLNQIRQQVL